MGGLGMDGRELSDIRVIKPIWVLRRVILPCIKQTRGLSLRLLRHCQALAGGSQLVVSERITKVLLIKEHGFLSKRDPLASAWQCLSGRGDRLTTRFHIRV
jgi:hypothetical protein